MKTKFDVQIYGYGDHTDAILKIIGVHNSGKKKISLTDIQTYLRVRDAAFLDGINSLGYWNEDDSLSISSDACKTLLLKITEKQIFELSETERDLLTKQELS